MAHMAAVALVLLALWISSPSAGASDDADTNSSMLSQICAFEQAERVLRPMTNVSLYMNLLKHGSLGRHMRGSLASSLPTSSFSAHSSCLPTLQSMRYALRTSIDGPLMLPHACGFEWFGPSQACSLLSQPPTTLLFIGDSITRHFMHAAQLLVRGDLSLGALKEDLPSNVSQGCTCNRQFAIKSCRQWILKDTHNLTHAPHPCPSARVVYQAAVGSFEFNPTQLKALVDEEQAAGRLVLLVLGGWGMHNGLKAKPVFRDLVRPVLSLINKAKWPSVQPLCLGIHKVQSNVPQVYQHVHNNKNVDSYNRDMHSLCTKQGIPFFDTYAITHNLTSHDGIHYGMLPNLLKAQLLLNFLSDRHKGISSVTKPKAEAKPAPIHRSLLFHAAQRR